MTWYAFIGAVEQGLVYGLMVLGVYITFRVLDFPDLTVDGSLPLGAAVSAVAITAGVDPYLSLILAFGAGFFAGMITGVLNTKFGILHLLASILSMIALYSINIRIMGMPNMTLLGKETILQPLLDAGIPDYLCPPTLFAGFAAVTGGLLVWFLNTQLGQTFIATGDNPKLPAGLGVNPHNVIIMGVGLSNALVALAGGMIAQTQGSADVNMGVGTIVAGLASVIVGETLLPGGRVARCVIAALIGSVVYRLAIALALSVRLGAFSVTPSDLNLITAILVVAALVAPRLKKKLGR